MSLENVRDFIARLDGAGELVRVARPVSVVREIAEVADRCMKSPGGGPALWFAQPALAGGKVSSIPVGINLFGSLKRINLALGVSDLNEIGARITQLLTMKPPEGWREKLALLPKLAELTKYPPRTVDGRPACQEIVLQGSDIDLAALPIITCWPEDGGPYITLPQVITRDPKTGVITCGSVM